MADSYQVLARKWRPQRFDDVVGQPAIVSTLRNALEQGRVAHAYCFSGIRGVGKTTTARLLAKGLNCRSVDEPTAEPCGSCESCREIEESRSLDVVEMDAASQTGVDDIRELKEFTRYSPSRDRYRVFIIDEAHMLSRSAFNALLKTLEEPPSHVIFVLATTEPQKILETVLSRCQHYHFSRVSQREIRQRLRRIADAEEVRVSDDALALLAQVADGSLRDAQSLLDKLISFSGGEIDEQTVVDLLGLVDRELLFRTTELVGEGDGAGMLEFIEEMVEGGVDLHQLAVALLGHLRNLTIVQTADDPAAILHLPEADVERLRQQAAAFEPDDLDRAFNLLAGSEYRIKQAEHPRYHLELLLLRLARMPRLRPLEELIADVRGIGDGGSGDRSGGDGGTPEAAAGARDGSDGGAARRVRSDADRPPGASPRRSGRRRPDDTSGRASSHGRREEDGSPAPGPPPPGGPVRSGRRRGSSPSRSATDSSIPEPTTEAAEAGSTESGPIARIFRRVREERPSIGHVLDRAEDAELRDDTLRLSFPDNGGALQEKARDQDALAAIEDAGRSILGREIRVVTGPAGDRRRPPAAAADPEGGSVDPQQRKERELWRRVEDEPLVQHFVDVLKGRITKVEEP